MLLKKQQGVLLDVVHFRPPEPEFVKERFLKCSEPPAAGTAVGRQLTQILDHWVARGRLWEAGGCVLQEFLYSVASALI